MKKVTGFYPRVHVDSAGTGVVSHAGGVLLAETVRVSGLDRALSASLARWRKPLAVHDPAKVVTDLALALALGGDCLADVALLRAEPGVFGPVASDPTVSRVIDALAGDARRALAAIDAWMQMLALTGYAGRRWEPKRLRLRLLSIAGRLAATGRRLLLHLSAHAHWAALATTALARLRAHPAPG